MYIVSLKYFDGSGHFLGDGGMLSPSKSRGALMEYVREQDSGEFCGFRPTYIYACPKTGSSVLIKVGG